MKLFQLNSSLEKIFMIFTLKSIIKKILYGLIFIITAVCSYPYIGWLKGIYDQKFGEPKYYFYGFIETEKARFLKSKVKDKNIKMIFRGCFVGGAEYEFEMMYNKAMAQYLPINYFKNLENEMKLNRLNEDNEKDREGFSNE